MSDGGQLPSGAPTGTGTTGAPLLQVDADSAQVSAPLSSRQPPLSAGRKGRSPRQTSAQSGEDGSSGSGSGGGGGGGGGAGNRFFVSVRYGPVPHYEESKEDVYGGWMTPLLVFS